jgi:hypothetical protein
LRHAQHHSYGEVNFSLVKKESARVAKMISRGIFLTPNVNFILKTARKISFHKDEV